MSELRWDAAEHRWVIVAAGRARRPHEFREAPAETESSLASCPFCPGNESETPPESFAFRPEARWQEPNGPGWTLRVVPNKFAALSPGTEASREKADAFFDSQPAFGFHEVIVETPDHRATLGTMPPDRIELILRSYLARSRALAEAPMVKQVVVFRNHGRDAGTSLRHPHSQVMALPLVPAGIRHRVAVARRYRREMGRSLYGDLAERELASEERVIAVSDEFLTFCPFASSMPYEVWILPRKGSASFAALPPEQCRPLALVLGDVAARLETGLGNPAFNAIVETAPCSENHDPHYSWHLRIVPRVTVSAGLEIGAGLPINPVRPEDAARVLREVRSARSRVDTER